MNNRKNIVVVLNYNDWEEVKRYCNAVVHFSTIDMIVVVDNMSTDDSYEQLKYLQSEKIVLLQAKENKGYAAGNNIGLQYILDNLIEGNVIISNPDIYYNEDDLKKVLEPLKDSTIGISTGLIHTEGNITSNFAWMVPGYWELLLNQYLTIYKIKRILGISMYCDYPKPGEERIYCNCVSGCFFCMTTETLNKIGLFDERTFLYGEENIFGFKVKENGQRTCVVVGTNIEHKQHHSINKNLQSQLNGEKWNLNSMLVYIKFYLKKGLFFQTLFKCSYWLSCCEKRVIKKFLSN